MPPMTFWRITADANDYSPRSYEFSVRITKRAALRRANWRAITWIEEQDHDLPPAEIGQGETPTVMRLRFKVWCLITNLN